MRDAEPSGETGDDVAEKADELLLHARDSELDSGSRAGPVAVVEASLAGELPDAGVQDKRRLL